MKSVNCATLTWTALDAKGRRFGVLAAKRSYIFDKSFQLLPAHEQELMNFSDLCYGALNETSLLYPSDLVPYKPRGEVILAADAWAPGFQPAPSWTVACEVAGSHALQASLKVFGRREWVPQWHGDPGDAPADARARGFKQWRLSAPEPAVSVPLRWEWAFGGVQKRLDPTGKEVIEAFEANPIGRGWIDPEASDHRVLHPAPQFEWEGQPIVAPYATPDPACLAPYPPAWQPRRL